MTAAVDRAVAALLPHEGRATQRTDYGEYSTPMVTLTAERAATSALLAALRPNEIRQAILLHGALQPDGDVEADGSVVLDSQTQWTCNECQEVVGTGDDFDGIVSMHQAHMVRLAIVGPS